MISQLHVVERASLPTHRSGWTVSSSSYCIGDAFGMCCYRAGFSNNFQARDETPVAGRSLADCIAGTQTGFAASLTPYILHGVDVDA